MAGFARILHLSHARSIVFFAVMVVAVGCVSKPAGLELADAGVATANTLAAYYDSLVQDMQETWEMEAFLSSFRKTPLTGPEKVLLQSQIDALNGRARLARRLGLAYSALKSQLSYDASGQVHGALTDLGSALTTVGVLPQAPQAKATIDVLGKIAGDIASIKQWNDFVALSQTVMNILENTNKLLAQERVAYRTIPLERGNKVVNVARELLQGKMVVAKPLSQKILDPLGLEWTSPGTPPDSDQMVQALTDLVQVREDRLALLSAAAADNVQDALTLLLKNHRDLANQKALNLNEVLAAIEKARSYLDELSKAKTPAK